jgi:radical SAM protein with 4Fe4S-binding SPASM domain
MCVHGQPGGMPDTGIMDVDLAKKVIDETAEHGAYSIKFSGRGEVLLHACLGELVKYAKDKGIQEVQINTNGMPLTEKKIEDLIFAGLDRIIFSLDGAKKETVEAIRIGANYEKIVENIKYFYTVKKAKKLVKPFLRVQMVRTKVNYDQIGDFFRMWQPYVDDIRISDVGDRGQGDNLAVGDQVSVGRKCCPMPWQRMFVARDGRVSPCCSDWFQEWVVGDARTERLIDIWNNHKMQLIRKINKEVKLSSFRPCSHCFSKDSYVWRNNV